MTKSSIAFSEGPWGASGDEGDEGGLVLEPYVFVESFPEGSVCFLDRGAVSGSGGDRGLVGGYTGGVSGGETADPEGGSSS